LSKLIEWRSGGHLSDSEFIASKRVLGLSWVSNHLIHVFSWSELSTWSLWQMSRPRTRTNEQTTTIAYFYSSRRKTWGTQGTGVHGRENMFGLIWTSNHFWVDLDVNDFGSIWT
jgi:hypothetical protein